MADAPILVVAAFPPELKALSSVLRARAQRGAAAVARAIVGVGLVEAAAGTARAIALLEPRAVVLLGTAGVYRARGAPAIGSAVLVRQAVLASLAVATGDAYRPGLVPDRLETDARLRGAIGRRQTLALVDVACPLGITRAARAGATLARHTGAAVENLEAFAVGRACAGAGVPFAAVLGITNVVGPKAHAEWKRNGKDAAAAACGVLLRWLEAPGRGR